jgi:hypothetical protein
LSQTAYKIITHSFCHGSTHGTETSVCANSRTMT